MRLLCVHAHFDDYEFVAGGTFEMFKRRFGEELRARILVCTDGQAGHHFRSREETGRMRMEEQQASAKLGGYEFEILRLPDGSIPREACLHVSAPLLAALWKVIRDFEPDYLFCPPAPWEPLAGIHVDHVAVADAVRKVAYMINVPHAFTPEYPVDETGSKPCKVPVILNLHDAYMAGENAYDFAVDIEEAFPLVTEMTWRHQSQISEWLPWVGRHAMPAPRSKEEWSRILRERFRRKNREMGIDSDRAFDLFTVTAWGELPESIEKLVEDFPAIQLEFSNLKRLEERLRKWRG